MKRFIALLLALFILALGLVACDDNEETCELLGTLLEVEYASIEVKISVENTATSTMLESSYTVKKENDAKRITYSYEQLNQFSSDNGEFVIPDSYKTTYKGSLLVKNGSVVEQDGVACNIPLEELSHPGLNFDSENFKDINTTDTSFTATVDNPQAFLNVDQASSFKNMKVTVEYSKDSLKKLIITAEYETEKIKVDYIFQS